MTQSNTPLDRVSFEQSATNFPNLSSGYCYVHVVKLLLYITHIFILSLRFVPYVL